MTTTLTRKELGRNCDKCLSQKSKGEKSHVMTATYELKIDARTWNLCVNHAAQSAHAMKIPSTFYQANQPTAHGQGEKV